MAFLKQASVSRYIQYLPHLIPLIKSAQAIHGASTGPQKKAAVFGAFAWLVGAAEPPVLANNPALAAFAPILDLLVAEMKQTGELPAAAPVTVGLAAVPAAP